MTKELLKQALEYLRDNQHWVADGERHAYVMEYNAFIDKLKQALAQLEQPAQQEPVLQDIEQYRLQMAGISTAAIGYWKESDGIHPDYDTIALRDVAKLYAKYDELYRAQRTWVELTEEQINELWANSGNIAGYNGLTFENIRAVSAKLKELNGG